MKIKRFRFEGASSFGNTWFNFRGSSASLRKPGMELPRFNEEISITALAMEEFPPDPMIFPLVSMLFLGGSKDTHTQEIKRFLLLTLAMHRRALQRPYFDWTLERDQARVWERRLATTTNCSFPYTQLTVPLERHIQQRRTKCHLAWSCWFSHRLIYNLTIREENYDLWKGECFYLKCFLNNCHTELVSTTNNVSFRFNRPTKDILVYLYPQLDDRSKELDSISYLLSLSSVTWRDDWDHTSG